MLRSTLARLSCGHIPKHTALERKWPAHSLSTISTHIRSAALHEHAISPPKLEEGIVGPLLQNTVADRLKIAWVLLPSMVGHQSKDLVRH
eukprot:1157346-Pelagomonas_calceolata.AAC.4